MIMMIIIITIMGAKFIMNISLPLTHCQVRIYAERNETSDNFIRN